MTKTFPALPEAGHKAYFCWAVFDERFEMGQIKTNLFCVLFFIFIFSAQSLALAAEMSYSAFPELFDSEDLLWEIKLGSHQYTIPIIDDGQLFIGIDDRNIDHPGVQSTGGGILMRLEPDTGKMVWQLPVPRNRAGRVGPAHFNIWRCGVCSQPVFDGKRLYIVGPRGDVLCIDRNGQADGNDGPFKSEAEYMQADSGYKLAKNDGDIIWRYDMLAGVDITPHDVCGSTPLLVGDYIYACTSNGQDARHEYIVKPEAPALIVLDKNTGKLAAVEKEGISKETFHCNWSSPVSAGVNGKTYILFGGGDGILYAFEPVTETADKPQVLKKIWEYDCNPPEYRVKDGKAQRYCSWRKRYPGGPSEIISIPAVYNGRVYVPIGQSPIHDPGQGMLSCIDIATGKKVWESKEVDRTTAQPVIADGLLYISDYSGNLHCFDADTGEHCWTHDMGYGTWCASPYVSGGKVYISTERKVFWVLKAGREKQVLSRSKVKSPAITPLVDNGVFYLPTQKRLFAIEQRP